MWSIMAAETVPIEYNSVTNEITLKRRQKPKIKFTRFMLYVSAGIQYTETKDIRNLLDFIILSECSSTSCMLNRLATTTRRDMVNTITSLCPKKDHLVIVSAFPGHLGFEADLLYKLGNKQIDLYLLHFGNDNEYRSLLTNPVYKHDSQKEWKKMNDKRLETILTQFPQMRLYLCSLDDFVPKADVFLLVDYIDDMTPYKMGDEKYITNTYLDKYTRHGSIVARAYSDIIKPYASIKHGDKVINFDVKHDKKRIYFYWFIDMVLFLWASFLGSVAE